MEKYLIFDFDGVIGDTYECAVATHVAYGSQPTREKAIEEMHEYFTNKPNHTRNHTKTDEEMAAVYKWTSEFGAIMQKIGFPLFHEFVAAVEAQPTTHKAIASSGSQNYVLPALAKTKINPTHILAFENHHSKEEKVETICKDWGVEVSDVYYFTDSLADVYELEGFISKDKLIGCSWGFCTKEDLLKELNPEHVIDTPAEFTALLS